MKRAMQAILIAGKDFMVDVLSGKKKITIREGHRDYSEGPVLLGCPVLNWAVSHNIVDVRHTTLADVSLADLETDGFKNHNIALNVLKGFYPTMTLESEVTVVKWD